MTARALSSARIMRLLLALLVLASLLGRLSFARERGGHPARLRGPGRARSPGVRGRLGGARMSSHLRRWRRHPHSVSLDGRARASGLAPAVTRSRHADSISQPSVRLETHARRARDGRGDDRCRVGHARARDRVRHANGSKPRSRAARKRRRSAAAAGDDRCRRDRSRRPALGTAGRGCSGNFGERGVEPGARGASVRASLSCPFSVRRGAGTGGGSLGRDCAHAGQAGFVRARARARRSFDYRRRVDHHPRPTPAHCGWSARGGRWQRQRAVERRWQPSPPRRAGRRRAHRRRARERLASLRRALLGRRRRPAATRSARAPSRSSRTRACAGSPPPRR